MAKPRRCYGILAEKSDGLELHIGSVLDPADSNGREWGYVLTPHGIVIAIATKNGIGTRMHYGRMKTYRGPKTTYLMVLGGKVHSISYASIKRGRGLSIMARKFARTVAEREAQDGERADD